MTARRRGPGMPMPDARERVVGTLPMVLDVRPPGVHHAVVVRSIVPHARIGTIDVIDALSMPGVVAVVTGRDIVAAGIDPHFGAMRADQPAIAVDRVRYAGEPVAVVVATERWQAREAAMFVDVEYDELPFVVDEREADSPGAPQLHDAHSENECGEWRLEHGDVDAAFASAYRVYEGTYRTPPAHHVPMETFVAVADWVRDDRLEIWTSAQSPHAVRTGLAAMFGTEDVSVRTLNLGGAYGAKGQIRIEPMAACVARLVGVPLRFELDRDEVFATIARHAGTVHLRTAVDADGRFVGREIDVVYNAGAYAITSPFAAGQGITRAPGPYLIPNVRARSRALYTNSVPTGPFRGAMTGQLTLAYELQLEEIAADLGIDALELRRRNLLHDGDTYATGEVMEGMHFDRILDELVAELGTRPATVPTSDSSIRRGRGVAITLKTTLTPSRTEARLVVDADGIVTVHASATEMGQGATATIMLNVAHELAMDPTQVRRLAIDTDRDPFDTATGSSRSTYSTGVALREAALDLRRNLDAIATGDVDAGLEHRDAGLVLPDGTWRTYGEVLREAGVAEVAGEGVFQSRGGWTPDGQLRDGGPSTAHWHQGGAAVDVEVDVETGRVRIVGAAGAAFAGVALDRTRVDQQNVGCVIMGLGHSLYEECIYDDGQLTNPNLSDYMIPSIADIPERIGSVIIEDLEHDEVHGVGEMAIPAVPAAVAAAIRDAVGVSLHDLPFTPEKVLRALEAQRGSASQEGRT